MDYGIYDEKEEFPTFTRFFFMLNIVNIPLALMRRVKISV